MPLCRSPTAISQFESNFEFVVETGSGRSRKDCNYLAECIDRWNQSRARFPKSYTSADDIDKMQSDWLCCSAYSVPASLAHVTIDLDHREPHQYST